MRSALRLFVLGLAFVACGDVTGAASGGAAGAPHASSARSSPVIADVEAPAGVRDQMVRLAWVGGYHLRVDRVTARLLPWSAFLGPRAEITGLDPRSEVWIVAMLGEFKPDTVIDLPTYPCELVVLDRASFEVRAKGGGAMSRCAAFFADLQTPPDGKFDCTQEPWGYGYRHGDAPISGRLTLTISRDDAWRLPTAVPGWAIYSGLDQYETYCRLAHIAVFPNQGPQAMLRALGSPNVTGVDGQAQVWLKNHHIVEAVAGSNAVKVVVEPRPGFEIASFDWRSVAPPTGANYIRFEFVDVSGREITFVVANGP